jgi:hypothetical protein
VVLNLVSNDHTDAVTWGWTATTLTNGQTSCTLLITAEGNLTLTSPNCNVTVYPYNGIFATAVTVQANFSGTPTDSASTSFEVAYP